MGHRWRSMSDKDKEPYIRATQDERHDLRVAARTHGRVHVDTPYIRWVKAMRPQLEAEVPGLDFLDFGCMAGARWTKLSDEAKEPYIRAAEAERAQAKAAQSRLAPGVHMKSPPCAGSRRITANWRTRPPTSTSRPRRSSGRALEQTVRRGQGSLRPGSRGGEPARDSGGFAGRALWACQHRPGAMGSPGRPRSIRRRFQRFGPEHG